ncbi:MAG: hypoxanthine phosphoribosyltransferase [Halieaceae bacterium]|jgi:hypoxanthine phosphoribosyltransferase|nr:hypoxanthine phosphoribosyltransferase [Halieaceae bacterium]
MSTTKTYLSADQLLNDSFQLGTQIVNSGFEPTFIVAIWRGGAPVGIAVQEILAYAGVQADNIAIRTSSYKQGIDQQKGHVEVYGLSYLVKRLTHEDKLLIVDDVFDTGRTIAAVIDRLQILLRQNIPSDIRVATPYYKPSRRQVDLLPDYYLHETDDWLVYPYEIHGLSTRELMENKPVLYDILKDHIDD